MIRSSLCRRHSVRHTRYRYSMGPLQNQVSTGVVSKMIILLLLFVTKATAQSCDYYQELSPGKEYYISSPNHPQSYYPGTSCRWFAVSPPGTHVYIACQQNLPASNSCTQDRLEISLTGDLGLGDSHKLCGYGEFTLVSTGNKMNIALFTNIRSQGGAFSCGIGVQNSTETEPEPEPSSCECGWKNGQRIVGGHEAGVNEYPMMAALIDGVTRSLFCGATIISQYYAVTAAHCLIDKKPRLIGLLVGDHDLAKKNETDSANLIVIDQFKIHEQYNTQTQVNDIAIVHVERPISFSLKVGPACLPFTNSRQNFAGIEVIALGWGTTEFGGLSSNTLQKVDLDVTTTRQCQASYGTMVSNKQLCTYKPDQDACQSDSGGPILWEDKQTNRVKLLGIISYGRQCATDSPGVNTRVTQYLPWIMENADDEYCVK